MESSEPANVLNETTEKLSEEVDRNSPVAGKLSEAERLNGDTEMEASLAVENNEEKPDEETSKTDDDDKTKAQGKKRKLDVMKEQENEQTEDHESSANESQGDVENTAEPVEEEPAEPSEETVEEKEEQETQKKPVVKAEPPPVDPIVFDTTLGKGKRSRKPNKKYEELTIKSFNKSAARTPEHIMETDSGAGKLIDETNGVSKIKTQNGIYSKVNSTEVTSSEDGRNEEDSESHKQDDSEVSSSAQSSPSHVSRRNTRLGSGASPATPQSKKQKLSVDVSNPCYLKPFEHGWKRELVYRAALDSKNQRQGDIYYITPSGRKIRSMRELTDTLKSKHLPLSVEDFTFIKEPLGVNDPEKEIIREAKVISKKGTPKIRPQRSVPSPPPEPVNNKVIKSPRIGSFKVKLPGTRLQTSQKTDRKRSSIDNEMEMGMLPPTWSPKKAATGKQSTWEAKPQQLQLQSQSQSQLQPCSIRCPGVCGLIPTLQCRRCLCLYHTECTQPPTSPTQPSQPLLDGYVCKNCQLDNQEQTTSTEAPIIGPPPLTPISSLKSNNTQLASPPKLQRIPRPGEKALIPPMTTQPPKLMPAPKLNTPKIGDVPKQHSKILSVPRQVRINDNHLPAENNKTIVGAVTTWFPFSSTIQMNNNQNKTPTDVITTPRPQGLVFMGDRKFLVVPRTNVLSVSPAIGAAASTPATKRVSSPTADKAPMFDQVKEKNKSSDNGIPTTASLGPNLQIPTIPTVANEFPPEPPPHIDKPLIVTSAPIAEPELTPAKDAKSLSDKLKQAPDSPPRTRRGTMRRTAPTSAPVIKVDTERNFMQNYLQNLSYGYQTLMYVFQYLKVQDLLRAGCVCTLWRDIAGHRSLWKTVRMKNSQVSNWEGLADALKKYGTENLDLRKMLLPSTGDDMWPMFSKAIARVDSLVRIELCRCPASVVEELAKSNNNLQVINAVTIRCESLDLTSMDNLTNLQELRLKSTNGFNLSSDLTPLRKLTQLKHLSLTSVKELSKQNVEVIGDLVNLESLDLGECSDFPDKFGSDVISKLTKLEKLRLEKGQGSCRTFDILEAVSKISTLEQLELVNFDVKAGFDNALGSCTNIKKLLIIPTYISQSATTNHMVLGGVIKLKSTLSHFVWGVTLELLRVTELFVDQCEESPTKDKKRPSGSGDSIPVLKPVPIMKPEDVKEESSTSKEPPQVEILPLPTLQKLLLNCLPTTRVKILKIPFHATWRQSIVDTVN